MLVVPGNNRSRPSTPEQPARSQPPPADIADKIRWRLVQELAWTAYEPNGEDLWTRVRQQTEALLYSHWRNGDLAGTTQEEAFYVRCDRTTMTQNDLDNGRLILLVGVAVVKPAEYATIEIREQVGEQRRRNPVRGVFPRLRREA